MSNLVFSQGDRVAERSSPGRHVFTKSSPQYELVRRYASTQRTGQVVAVVQRSSSRGSQLTYVDVLWDGRRSPSPHAASRLVRLAAVE